MKNERNALKEQKNVLKIKFKKGREYEIVQIQNKRPSKTKWKMIFVKEIGELLIFKTIKSGFNECIQKKRVGKDIEILEVKK